MKILIISGFLGAGKTTFIQELAKQTKKEFTIMENEYGDTGIDGDLLNQESEENENRLKIWELTEGCICCSLKSDFASSILTIANSIDPEYLIVEPTGVGMLSSVLANISKIQYERIKILQPITVVDINCIDDYLNSFKEIYSDQIKTASQILISKLENSTPRQIEKATTIIKKINPSATIISHHYSLKKKEWWNELLNLELKKTNSSNPIQNIEPPNLENIALNNISIDSIETLIGILVAILRGTFGSVYRLKGFTPINGQWTKFDIVNKEYKIETCSPKEKAKAVVIGMNLNKKHLQEIFNSTTKISFSSQTNR